VTVHEVPLGTPAAALPGLRLLAAFGPPNLVRLKLAGGDGPLLETPIGESSGDDHLNEVIANRSARDDPRTHLLGIRCTADVDGAGRCCDPPCRAPNRRRAHPDR
jgi:hypothetical protein